MEEQVQGCQGGEQEFEDTAGQDEREPRSLESESPERRKILRGGSTTAQSGNKKPRAVNLPRPEGRRYET